MSIVLFLAGLALAVHALWKWNRKALGNPEAASIIVQLVGRKSGKVLREFRIAIPRIP